MTMPTDNRATAERIAREVYESGDKGLYEWKHLPDRSRENITAYVLAGMAHRDRTAEREAAKKAWDAAAERRYGPGWPLHSSSDKARDAYLAAEFDAGERVTLSDGSVVTRHPTDAECPWRRDYTNSTTRPPRITNATQWSDLFMPTDTGADFDAVKRLAQRGAER